MQIDKTQAAIDLAPTEAKRLMRQVRAAQAEAALIGAESGPGSACRETAELIRGRNIEIQAVLGS